MEQEYFWKLYISGHGNLAARPGTSNHGWGVAVDVPTVQMAQLINKYGSAYGWQKRWSDAASEWWHFKYSPQHDKNKGEQPQSKPDAAYLTDREAKTRRELLRLRRKAKKAGGWDQIDPANFKKAKQCKDRIRAYRRGIKEAAQKHGWNKRYRVQRYRSLGRALNG